MRKLFAVLPVFFLGMVSQSAFADPATDPAPAAPAAVATDYTLKASSSALFVVVHKDPNTLAAGLAHDIANAPGTDQVAKCMLGVSVVALVDDDV